MIRRSATLTRLSRLGACAILLICGITLTGWLLQIPVLVSIVPGWPRMAPAVILCFLLCITALFALTLPAERKIETARLAAASLVLATGAYFLIDFLLTGGSAGPVNLLKGQLGRPSPASAVNFLAAAIALALPREERWGNLYSGLVTLGLLITALDFVGYAYGIAALSRGPTVSAMSLPTMTCFMMFFASALLARPYDGWTAIIFAHNSGGIAARRLFPAMVILPFIVNGMVVLSYRFRPFEAPFGFAILSVAMAVGLGIVTIAIANWLAHHENERQRSQALLEAIVENSMAVIYVKDLAGRYLLVNRGYLDNLHVERASVIGKTDYDLFSKYEAAAFRAMDDQVLRADRPLVGEELSSQADGFHTFISIKAPVKDPGGRPYAIFGISTDITDRKRSEKALAASEERTRLIIETALDAVISIDRDGAITGWNHQAERILGWRREEAIGRQVEDLVMPPAYREAHRRGMAHYLATGEGRVLNRRIELTALHREGHEFPVELSITPVRQGEAISFSAFIRDITDRKNAETRLQEQLARLGLLERITRAINQRQDMRSIFQVVARTLEERLPADFVCICAPDAAGAELRVGHIAPNSAALGLELGIVEGAALDIDENGLSRCMHGALLHEPDGASVNLPFARRLARGGLHALVVTPLRVEDEVTGLLVVCRRKAGAFSSADCEFLKQLGEHVALAAHQVKLRASLENAYDDLKRTQQAVMQQERWRALGQVASGIAHDINNAISPVAVYTQSLLEREPDLPPRIASYLETVERVVQDVSTTVSRMRDFYRGSDSDAELQALDLNALVPQVVELTRARWSDMPRQRGIAIRVATRLERDLPPVMGNATGIREVLTNLIFNAVDALPDGGTIAVRTASSPDPARPELRQVLLEVADTGIGMSEDTRLRCLEPFFTTKGERGTGLGLAMVYGAAQRHKATLDIDSALGEGTRVTLAFPATSMALEPQPPDIDPSEIPPLRLLLVDDDPAVLGSTKIVLELDGHTVLAADGGEAGIAALRQAKEEGRVFDVIVTDLGMPYVDGQQLAHIAKELFPSTPVVLLTGWGKKMGDSDHPYTHVDCVLPKPLNLDDLRAVFARCGEPVA